ncbi:MAG TPA: hypothetical protein PLN24_08225 [Victivallales bacterium]|nr:hypothetical protein [Victivallales bacterium]HRU01245.1 hypothetical protein [Victivallales bacterium]
MIALMLAVAIGVLYSVQLNAGDDGELKFEHSEYCVKAKAEGMIKAPTGYKSGDSVNNELISEFKFDSVSDGATGVISATFAKNAKEKDEKAQVTVQFYPIKDIPGEEEQSLSATCVPVRKSLVFEKEFIAAKPEIGGRRKKITL